MPKRQQPHPGPSRQHYRELDGVRGFAALAVFFHHLCFASIGAPPAGSSVGMVVERALFHVSALGAGGVDLFFVLSGFLITSLLLKDQSNPAYYKDFYWKRALRILPLYMLCLVGLLLFFPGSWRYVLLAAVFLPNFASVIHVSAYGPFWSLGIEEQFYLLWPTMIHRRPVRYVMRWSVYIWVGVVVLRLVAAFFGHSNYLLTPLRLDGLAAGAFLACRMRQHGTEAGLRTDRHFFSAAIVIGVPLIVFGFWREAARSLALHDFCNQTGTVLVAFGVIAFLVAYAGDRRIAWVRSAPLLFFGAISYAFYMTHAYVMEIYDHFSGALPAGSPAAFALRFFVVLIGSIGVCLLTRYVIELPAISLRKYVLYRPAPKPEIAEPLVPR
jgi:peptidoglycan/LPS O-acetylase OafA/YrhL